MKNIVLIGFMGSGKTSCGRELAQRAGVEFLDTDDLIEKQEGCTISHIFESRGEACFREMETALVQSLVGKKVGVLSVGGGLPVTEGNGDILRQIGTVVYLKADVDVLVHRLQGDESRPLLAGGSLRERITGLMEKREQSYQKAAHVVLETGADSVAQVAEKLERLMEES